jgi:hypothetical protein
MAVLPFIMSALSLVFWKLMSMALPNKFRYSYLRNTVTTSFVFAYLAYPSITNLMFEGLNCFDIEGVFHLKRDFGIECWSPRHMKIIFLLVVPIFFIWVLGFPLVTLYKMYKARKHLDQPDNIIKYGLFYIGLRDQTFFWEIIVNNLRKVLIVALSVTI